MNLVASSAAHRRAGVYHYDGLDRAFVAERVAEFRDQVARRLSGALSEDEFRPLRLMNGLYLQLHAYMLRVAIPYGVLSAPQLRCLAEVARTYDRGYGHFTTRQNIQFNWPRLVETPDILQALSDADLHAIQTSGNCIRNVTTDEYAGAAADELVDPRVYAEILRQWSTRHPEFTYLPRKFKIAIVGAPLDRAAIKFHDIGLIAKRNGQGEIGFTVYAGGGLGRTPVVGIKLRDFLPESEFLAYMEAILRTYNALGERENIYRARIKILVREMGQAFIDRVEAEYAVLPHARYRIAPEWVAQIGAHFAPPAFQTLPRSTLLPQHCAQHPDFAAWVGRNTHPHRVAGYTSAVVSLKPVGGVPGDATAEQMETLADLADRFSFSEIRVSHVQNLVLPHVRQDDLFALWQALAAAGLGTPNLGLITDIITCPGLDFCALANARSIPVAQAIAARFADLGRQAEIGEVFVNISGCINACGHHHAGHIGILGVDKRGEEFYQITLGGSATNDATVGDIIGAAFSYDQVVDAVETLIVTYLARRDPGERFIETYRRIGPLPFKEALYADPG